LIVHSLTTRTARNEEGPNEHAHIHRQLHSDQHKKRSRTFRGLVEMTEQYMDREKDGDAEA
jgi:hypothetical protein